MEGLKNGKEAPVLSPFYHFNIPVFQYSIIPFSPVLPFLLYDFRGFMFSKNSLQPGE